MNKKLILLPFLAVSLLVGCSTGNGSETSKDDSASQQDSGSSDVKKEIWEEDEVEGESTIQQVKEGTEGEYYTVRGTVVANSGSTLAIYRKGQFLYCYNFNATNHDNIAEHPLGAYVEIHAISSAYSGSVQLTAYDVGNKGEDKYDQDATLKVLQEKGETVAPVKASVAADFANGKAAGELMEVEFVAGSDFTLDASKTDNQDLAGKVGEVDFTIRMEKYLPADVKTALLEANPAQFADHATYKVVVLGAATSSGNVRGLLVEGSSWSKTADAHFDDPTEVLLDSTETQVEVGKTLALDWAVMPETAKQAVTFSSSDDTKATVDANGVVTGVAVADEVTITATATVKPEVKGTFKVKVVAPAAAPLTETVALDFSARTEQGTYLDSIAAGKTVTDVIKEAAGTKASHIVEASSSNVTSGNGTGGAHPNTAGLLKFGSGSKVGTLTIELDGLVNKVEISCHDWNKKNATYPTNSNTLSVNGGEEQLMTYNETGAAGTLTFNLEAASDTISILSNKRGFVWTITLSYVAA